MQGERPADCQQDAGSTLPQRAASVPLADSPFFDLAADVDKYRGSLPHWRQAGKLYFVTFRLADSLAQTTLNQWREERAVWESFHPKPWSPETWGEFHRRFTEPYQRWLDAGHGACWLRQPACAALVEEALRYFDSARYELGDYVVMPNHVHALVAPIAPRELAGILHSWKSFTAKQINKVLHRTGPVWREEYFDHLVRSEAQLAKFRRYIAENPLKAGLGPHEYRLGQRAASVPLADSAKPPPTGSGQQDAGSTLP